MRDRHSFTTPGARQIPVFVQMFVWITHAPSTKLRLYFPSKPTERCEFCRIPTHSTQTVRPYVDILSRTPMLILLQEYSRDGGNTIKTYT
jgi:hypothetical protein